MDWSNVDLDNAYQVRRNFLEGMSFEELITLTDANISSENITEETVMAEFETHLAREIESSREVMRSNIKNIVQHLKNRK